MAAACDAFGVPAGGYSHLQSVRQRPAIASPTPTPLLYITNRSSNSVAIFPIAAAGSPTPFATIAGSNTGLSSPSSIGFDSSGLIYVLNSASVSVFNPGSSGNATPKYFISGALTQLTSPQALTVDTAGDFYVTNQGGSGGFITYFAAGSNNDRAPARTIYDGINPLFTPVGIALHGSLLYVADQGDQSINEYAASSNGIVNPTTMIDGVSDPVGVAVDPQGHSYVTNGTSLAVYAANATGSAKPLRIISVLLTGLDSPAALCLKTSDIFLANSAKNSVLVFPASGNGDVAPLRKIYGANPNLDDPIGIGAH